MGGLGYTTNFNFKHLPDFDRMSTERGTRTGDAGATRKPGTERSALVALIMAGGVVGAVLLVGVRAASQVAAKIKA
jgi:hypothetical protein